VRKSGNVIECPPKHNLEIISSTGCRAGAAETKEVVENLADNIKRLARRLGAKVVARIPDTGGGAIGAARLRQIVTSRATRSS
jgi:hypothetical protein